jgi:hypothetical protein
VGAQVDRFVAEPLAVVDACALRTDRLYLHIAMGSSAGGSPAAAQKKHAPHAHAHQHTKPRTARYRSTCSCCGMR